MESVDAMGQAHEGLFFRLRAESDQVSWGLHVELQFAPNLWILAEEIGCIFGLGKWLLR
jgi:hypothetical protein